MTKLWVIGSGGHARVTIEGVRAEGKYEVVGLLDDDPERVGKEVDGVTVRGAATLESIQAFDVGQAVIAIGSNRARRSISARLDNSLEWITVLHPAAHIAPGSTVGPGSVVFAGAIVQTGCRIGQHVILNTKCSVDHDGVVESFAHIAPGATLAGQVSIGEGAFVGLGSGIISGIRVGEWSIIGAGAVTINDVPGGTTVVGVPARPIR